MAGVLIPTFGNVIEKANQSAFKQEAANAFKEEYAEMLSDGDLTNDTTLDGKNSKTSWSVTSNDTFTFTYTTEKYTITYTAGSTNNGWGTITPVQGESEDPA